MLSSHVFCWLMSVNYFLSVSLVANYGIDGICLVNANYGIYETVGIFLVYASV